VVHELEKAGLVQDHISEMDSMTKRLQEAEQRCLDELDRLKYEHFQVDPRSKQASFYPHGIQPQAMPMPMQNAPYVYTQMQLGQYKPLQPPNQPGYQSSAYFPGKYAPQTTQPISRNSSPISEQRPAVIIRQPQPPSMTPSMSYTYTPQPKAISTPSPTFRRPARKSAAIIIKRPDSEAIDVESFKAPTPPTPSAQARPPPVVTFTPTPPSKSSTHHA
jgi:translation initiation factor 4G